MDEYYIFNINGQTWYYKDCPDLKELSYNYPRSFFIEKGPLPIKIKAATEYPIKDFKGKCCYCECDLNHKNISKDHVIPKRYGGKITKLCCDKCNSEKSCHFLDGYIRVLLWRIENDKKLSINELAIYKTKLKNAIRIKQEEDGYLLLY